MSVDEHTVALPSGSTFYLSAPTGSAHTPVFIHGVPTSADIWVEVLARTGGIAPDLPGFGRSDKGGHLDYTLSGLAGAVAELVQALELGPVALVGHDWGAAVALQTATLVPVTRLALIEPAPALTWSRLDRVWRTPGLGELAMGAVTRRALARHLRRRSTSEQAWPDARIDAVWRQFDQGTQRAVLRLYRSTDAGQLQTLAGRLPDIETLVLHGEQGREPAERIAAQISGARVQAVGGAGSGARVQAVDGAGHWPWLDRAEAIATIAEFLAAP